MGRLSKPKAPKKAAKVKVEKAHGTALERLA
jgi:hypothetical protein